MADDLTDDDLEAEPEVDDVDEEGIDDEESFAEDFDGEETIAEEEEETAEAAPAPKPKPKSAEEEEESEDDDEELDPDDVEADLDTILKDRLVVADDDEEDDEEDEVPEADDKAEGTKVRPRAPGEFVCQSCFLVKHPSQLADPDAQLCRDCV
jgi:hypothetical protein